MKKLRLELEDLAVSSFATSHPMAARGTVNGHYIVDYIPEYPTAPPQPASPYQIPEWNTENPFELTRIATIAASSVCIENLTPPVQIR